MKTSTDTPTLAAIQRRTVIALVAGQILGGLGMGATIAIGSVLVAEMANDTAWSGAAATMSTLGAAAAAIPLARLAQRLGRRPALAIGAFIAALGSTFTMLAAVWVSLPLVLLGFGMLGVGAAVGLQARFAATDVAAPAHRGRDLSIVVWSTTVGAIVGPNLFGPGVYISNWLQLPELTGSFVIALAAQLAATATYLAMLRPDPLILSRSLPEIQPPTKATGPGVIRERPALLFAIGSIAISHAVMVSVMSMTPVHLVHHGASLTIVGFTISMHVAGMFALSPVFGWVSDRFGRVPTILGGQALLVAALVTVALGQASTTAVTVGLALLGLGWSASTVSGSAYVADLVTGPGRARIQGRTDLAMNIAGAGGGALAGVVLAMIGYDGLAWSVVALVAGVVAWAIVIRPRSTVATGAQ